MDSLVVALVGLGGLYAIAQDKKKEGFSQPIIPQGEASHFPQSKKKIQVEDDEYRFEVASIFLRYIYYILLI